MARAVGPLGRAVEAVGVTVKGHAGYQLGADANPLVLLHRVAFADDRGRLDEEAQRALLGWAERQALGQDRDLVRQVAARRERALAALRAQGYAVARLRATTAWRLAVGLGNRANAHEIGLALHGTYGWPVIPGSTLKGLTCAWALRAGDPARVAAIFGLPRVARGEPGDQDEADPGDQDGAAEPAGQGTVRFLDALPAAEPVAVARDVLTPHVRPYYADTAADGDEEPRPPAEYHNPVPVWFLVTCGGSFAVDLVGRAVEDVRQAARWCAQACEELGVGAKTSAGYGYLKISGDWEDT